MEKMETNGSSVASSKFQFHFKAPVLPYYILKPIKETGHHYYITFKNQQAKLRESSASPVNDNDNVFLLSFTHKSIK